MVKQPPQLLTRVLRAISALREVNGSTVTSIVTQVRNALGETAALTSQRNVTMQVRRALKHAVDNGLVSHRAGKYRVTGRKRLVPVDSLELAIDASKRRRRKKSQMQQKSKTYSRSRKGSEHDYRSKSARKQRRPCNPRRKSHRKRSLTKQSSKSSHPTRTPSHHSSCSSKPGTAPASSRPATAASTHGSAAPESSAHVDRDGLSELERDETTRRRRRPRRKRNIQPIPKNPPDAVPTVQDEPMDAVPQLRPCTGKRSIFGSHSDDNEVNDDNADNPTYFN